MGYYNAVHLELKLKSTAPAKLVEYLDLLWDEWDDTLGGVGFERLEKDLRATVNNTVLCGLIPEDFSSYVLGRSAYHETWHVQVKPSRHHYRSFASTKRFDVEDMALLALVLLPYLDVNDGDVVARYTGEGDYCHDYLLFIDTANQAVGACRGMAYTTDHGYLTDSRHPYKSEEGGDIFIPIMNRNELITLGLIKTDVSEYYLKQGKDHVVQRPGTRPMLPCAK